MDRRSTRRLNLAVISMVQAQDFPQAWSSLRSVEEQLPPDSVRIVLLNDRPDPALEARLDSLPKTVLIRGRRNLGVAAGRNLLIEEALRREARLILSLDDDLLVPEGTLSRLVARYDELRGIGRPGIVAPAILDFHAFGRLALDDLEIRRAESGKGTRVSSTAIKDAIIDLDGAEFPPDLVYHLGIRNWRAHYLKATGPRTDRLRRLLNPLFDLDVGPSGVTELRADTQIAALIADPNAQPIPVDSLPGGACLFSSDLVREIGGISAAFSPFGYEDSDFALRASRAGYQNHLMPSEVLLHDLGRRGKARDRDRLLFTRARSRWILARRHLNRAEFLAFLTDMILFDGLMLLDIAHPHDANPSRFLATLSAYAAGSVDGAFRVEANDRNASIHGITLPASHRLRCVVPLPVRAGGPRSGLLTDRKAIVELNYDWMPETGRLNISRARFDAPGLGLVDMSLSICGLRGDTSDLLESAAIERLEIKVIDHDLLARAASSIAWHLGDTGPASYFRHIVGGVEEASSPAVRWFLGPRDGRAAVHLRYEPSVPRTMGTLRSFPGEASANDLTVAWGTSLGS